MAAKPEITFLGTGTSIGVPVIGCDCEVCTSDDPRNKRLRSSILVKSKHGQLVVDTGPDFRQQCLREGITNLDAAIFTHAHTDHIMGFDDLRRFTVAEDDSLPIYANRSTLDRLKMIFDYAFNGRNRYIGYFKPDPQEISGPFEVCGWEISPLPVLHGKVETIGFHFSSGEAEFAYIPDAKSLSEEALSKIEQVPLLILDGLQPKTHFTHLSIPEAVAIAESAEAGETWLTHFSCRVDYQKIEPTLPAHVHLAWDGLKLELSRN